MSRDKSAKPAPVKAQAGTERKGDGKEFVLPKDATIDEPVDVVSLDADKYHKNGKHFVVGRKTAEKYIAAGWVRYKEEGEEEEIETADSAESVSSPVTGKMEDGSIKVGV